MPDFTRDEWDDMQEGWAIDAPPWEPWDVECARCGVILKCDAMCMVESGDGDWECEPCNIRCDAKEYYDEQRGIDIDFADLAAYAIVKHLSKG